MKKVNILTNAQITAFMILGMVVLLLFLFIYVAAEKIASSGIQSRTSKLVSDVLYSRTVRLYTENCLKSALEDGLEKLGKQGGYIDTTVLQPDDYVTYDSNKVAYWIKPDLRPLPQYPCPSGYSPPAYCKFIHEVTQGVSYGLSRPPSCPDPDSPYDQTKYIIEQFIKTQITSCVDPTTFLANVPSLSGMKLTNNQPIVKATFGENNVLAELTYQITLTPQNKEPIIVLADFNSNADVRFKKICASAREIAGKDVSNLNFDIIADTRNGQFDGKDLGFKQLPGAKIDKRALDATKDIIIITDPLSRINGKEYVFQFARANRPPVLDYINNNPGTDYDYSATIGTPIQVNTLMSSIDPDENVVSYSFSSSDWLDASNKFNLHQSYTPITADIGDRSITITVSDGDLRDWQEVRFKIS